MTAPGIRIEKMTLSALLSMRHEGNPKMHSIDQLILSFTRFGFTMPPAVDEMSKIMIAGHGRCEALARMRNAGDPPPLGIDVDTQSDDWIVPVIRGLAFKNKDERDAYLIADNALPMLGGWNDDALANMLYALEPIGLEGIGLDDDRIRELLKPDKDGDKPESDGTEVDVTGHTRVIGAHKVRPPAQMTNDDWEMHLGDCLEGLKQLADNSVDALVTDPPAGIAFMSREWDSDKGGRDKWIEWLAAIMRECVRVLKPGAHGFAWALPRTSHWTAFALEDGGFELRDRASHLFLSGFPKSLDVDKAVAALLERERQLDPTRELAEPEPSGRGTALKPALEDWWLVRKPLEGTVAENVLRWGTGAINIDACRIGDQGGTRSLGVTPNYKNDVYGRGMGGLPIDPNSELGRWPSHTIVSDGVVINDVPTPAMYFYCPKPAKSETEAGLGDMPIASGGEATGRTDGSKGLSSPRAGAGRGGDRANVHPTKKPIALMRWLVRLVCPPGGLVLDPFAGSGTTGLGALAEGCRFVGFERENNFHAIACARLRSFIEEPRDDEPVEEANASDEIEPA